MTETKATANREDARSRCGQPIQSADAALELVVANLCSNGSYGPVTVPRASVQPCATAVKRELTMLERLRVQRMVERLADRRMIRREQEGAMTYNLTPEQAAELWDGYAAGLTVSQLARRFVRRQASMYQRIQTSGGIRPTIPERAARHLSFEDREEISRGLAAGHSLRHIADGLGRSHSTISQLRRGSKPAGRHEAGVGGGSLLSSAVLPAVAGRVVRRLV